MTQKERVLRYVNRLRQEYGIGPALDELPKGRPGCPWACVIARAIHGGVDTERISVGHDGLGPRHRAHEDIEIPPKYVAAFIRAFDRGCYPELIAA